MGKGLKQAEIEIKSIFGGHQATWFDGGEDTFLASYGIDPEISITAITRPAGVIMPTRYADISTSLTGCPMFITGAQTSGGVFTYCSDGTVVLYSSTYGSEYVKADLTNGAGNGAVGYNDYFYCAVSDRIWRLGRLSATEPTFAEYWVTTLGMTALTNTTYPATRNIYYPNHVLYPHSDGYVYVLDYDGANGRLHAFITSSDGTGGSGEFNVLTLPPGMMPMAAAPLGTDIAVVASPQGNYALGAVPQVGKAKMFLWDTVRGNKFYKSVDIGENLATAIVNLNGVLHVTAGSIDGGFKLLRYLGGESFEVVSSLYEGSPPMAGAIDVMGNMVAFAGTFTYPIADAGVLAYGYRDGRLERKATNHIARSNAVTGTLPIIGALSFLRSNGTPTIGWRTDSDFGIDNAGGTAAYRSVWYSKVYSVNRPFTIKRILFPLTDPMASGMNIEIDVFADYDTTSYGDGESGLKDINTTNFTSSEQIIDLKELSIKGNVNFYIKLAFVGTTEVGVSLPIHVELEYLDG